MDLVLFCLSGKVLSPNRKHFVDMSSSDSPSLPPLHLQVFISERVEFYIYTTSISWSWETFLYDGIFEHKAKSILKVTKGVKPNPDILHIYHSEE